MGTGDRAALDRLLGGPEMAWLVERVRGRILPAGGEPLSGVVQLNEPTDEQRTAAVRLMGRPKRAGATLRVDLAVVEQVLRRGPWPAGLADAVEALSGPIVDRRAERDREAAAWDAARDGLGSAFTRFPHLAHWWHAWCQAGGLKRVARAEAARTSATPSAALAADLVRRLTALLEELPAAGEPLAVLARRVEGDAHSLDASRPLGRLAVAVIEVAFTASAAASAGEPGGAASAGEPGTAAADGEPGGAAPDDWAGSGGSGAASPRDVWAAAGVVMSNVASTVLCLGVPGAGLDPQAGSAGQRAASGRTGAVATSGRGGESTASGHSARTATAIALGAMWWARMPVLLTLDQVRSGGVRALPENSVIHVCENPTVLEVVAARWAHLTTAASQTAASQPEPDDGGEGTDAVGPVLVCTSGQPSTAVLELLRRLAANGARCRYHGDFDWAGLRIARSLGAHVAWEPWRYEADDYRSAVQEGKPSRRLAGSPAESPWDPGLAIAMAGSGLAVEEEAVADQLAADVLAGWASR